MPKARKPMKTAGPVDGVDTGVSGPTSSSGQYPPPTYPLSPTEIEVILHIRWNGNGFERSSRAGKTAVVLQGDELQTHARRLPFDPERRKVENRSVEYDILTEEDFTAMLHRAHRVQLVTADGEVPELLTGEFWVSGRKGVSKPDGIGILLSRPML
jgi:hypothetical protein